MNDNKIVNVKWYYLFVHVVAYIIFILTVTFTYTDDATFQRIIRYSTAIWTGLIGMHTVLALGLWNIVENYLADKIRRDHARDNY